LTVRACRNNPARHMQWFTPLVSGPDIPDQFTA